MSDDTRKAEYISSNDFPVLQAKIMTAYDKGVNHDFHGTIDSNPDRSVFTIEPINCESSDFLEVFLASSCGECFCSDGVHLIDIGGSNLDLTLDCVLTIGRFEWLNIKVMTAKREIEKNTKDALARLLTNN